MSRLLFTKEGVSIWSSHLDLMRALMRSFRRAGIDLKHSQGFTPHPELSILMPLSVGVESQCEIADFTLAEGCEIPAAEIAARLNPVLPAGIRALESYESGQKAGKLAWLRARLTLSYEATGNRHQASGDGGRGLPRAVPVLAMTESEPRPPVGDGALDAPPASACRDGSQPSGSRRSDGGTGPSAPRSSAQDDRVEAIRELFDRPSLIVEKHGKRGTVETDIAPMIRELKAFPLGGRRHGEAVTDEGASGEPTGVVIEAVAAAQNPTLNPLLLATAIETYLPQYKPDLVRCRRLEIYDADMNVFR